MFHTSVSIFFVCWPKLTAFFVFSSLSEVHHNVLKKTSQDIFPRFWCPLIFKFILLSLFLIYCFPPFLKIIFREAELLASSQAVSNLPFAGFKSASPVQNSYRWVQFEREDFEAKFSATHTGPERPLEIALVCFFSQEPE